ncbi:hypothetical protein JB92DRAFT_3108258 [Gautieria morchelliformis]|nr:hypothetical protein JB92DRAFT_3108258 [Gautieria morchelliformis]
MLIGFHVAGLSTKLSDSSTMSSFTSTNETLLEILSVVKSLSEITSSSSSSSRSEVNSPASTPIATEFQFSLPEPLAPQLLAIGVPAELAQDWSESYLQKAEQLQILTEATFRDAVGIVPNAPQGSENQQVQDLLRRLFEALHHDYQTTLQAWAESTMERARSHLQSIGQPQ